MAAKRSRDELTVYGYMNKQRNILLSDKIIPNEIDEIIFEFYYIKFGWDLDISSKHVKITENICQQMTKDKVVPYAHVYGNDEINEGIKTWKIKAHDIVGSSDLFIGIIAQQNIRADLHNFFRDKLGFGVYNFGWCFGNDGAQKKFIGCKYRDGDLVTMTLDLDKQTLHYKINENDIGNIPFTIPKGNTYRLVCATYINGVKYEIMDG